MKRGSKRNILAALAVGFAGFSAPSAQADPSGPRLKIDGTITSAGAGSKGRADGVNLLQAGSSAVVAAASTRPPGGANYNYADGTYDQCNNTTTPPLPSNPAEMLPKGWFMNAFFWCRKSNVDIRATDGNGVEKGRMTFTDVAMGYTYQGERGLSVQHYISNVRTKGDLINGKIALSADWDRYTGKSYPTSSNGNKLKYVEIKKFGPSSVVSESYVADESIGDSDDEKIWQGKVGFDWVVTSPLSNGVAKDNHKIDVRFDSGQYLTYKTGSVFVDWKPVLEYNINEPIIHDTAEHILRAQTDPASTKPEAPGKVIPGAPSGKPLTRLLGSHPDVQKNRDAARKVCNQHWPGYPNNGTKDCDEYPFATTYERRGGTSSNYSAYPVGSGDNQEAGRRLAKFVGEMRILDGDDYYVHIETDCDKFC
ncbi:NucA/NucB deoxyribonuclease domain-containing protein [Streptomyces massasporeus]